MNYTKKLASGEGTVNAMTVLGTVYASVWYTTDDRKELLETWETNGTLADMQAVRAMAQGFVNSFAAAN